MSGTHTFVVEHYANPYLRCETCGSSVVGYIVSPGHDEDRDNYPCRHRGFTSVCPSWGPVDGCRCHRFGLPGHVADFQSPPVSGSPTSSENDR